MISKLLIELFKENTEKKTATKQNQLEKKQQHQQRQNVKQRQQQQQPNKKYDGGFTEGDSNRKWNFCFRCCNICFLFL